MKLSLTALLLIFSLNINAAATEQTLEQALLSIESAISENDSDKFNQLIDFNLFIKRVLSPLSSISKANKQSFRKGFMSSSSRFSERLIEGLKNAIATRLKVQEESQTIRAMYRFDLGEEGYNYLEFILVKNKQGDYKIVDWYSHISAEYVSATVSQLLVFALPGDGVIKEFMRIVNGDKQEIKRITQALAAFSQSRDPRPFVEAYEKSGDVIKSNSSISMLYLLVAGQLNDMAIYERALRNFAKYHGKNPRFSFAMVDHYYFLGEYGNAIQAINRFERVIGVADPALYFLRANTYMEAKNYPESIKQSRQAIKLDPNFEDAYWTQVNVQISMSNFNQAIDTLKLIESRFGYAFETTDFENEAVYLPLMQSKEFKQWLP